MNIVPPPSTNKSFCMLIGHYKIHIIFEWHHKIHIIFEWLVGTRGGGGGGTMLPSQKCNPKSMYMYINSYKYLIQ